MPNPSSSSNDVGNHPQISTAGGASAVPTPANNADGGSGWGDKDFFKGGGGKTIAGSNQGVGHAPMPNPAASFGNFLGLSEQKEAANANMTSRFKAAAEGSEDDVPKAGTCETEDHSFQNHKPGCPRGPVATAKEFLTRAAGYAGDE
ncbi:hypothetical protein VTN49DRAFT_570 [Thermomyces lanuginosus]|uniref:uncharacterized protein n=1 Tax=Thermomyces lanuginosus TaxID=5541 RepID=UPI003743BD7A